MIKKLKQAKYKRPFFSIIISCYNSGEYLDFLLESLCHQGIKKEEYEIVISDDCSTESYDYILDKFRDKLIIRKVVAEKNYGYPGPTREQGRNFARGEWIIFSDHDDAFFKDALKQVKRYIKKNNPQYAVYTIVQVGKMETREPIEDYENDAVTHGKFYNLDNLMNKYNIHYNMKLRTEEDIYFNTSINILVDLDLITIDQTDIYAYIWYCNNHKSISHSRINDREFAEYTHNDFLRATFYVFFKALDDYNYPPEEFLYRFINSIMFSYGIINKFIFKRGFDDHYKENDYCAAQMFKMVQDRFDFVDVKYIMDFISENNGLMFYESFRSVVECVGAFIPRYSIEDWLNYLVSLFPELENKPDYFKDY